MRVATIKMSNEVLPGFGPGVTPACGWPGCREPATGHATYKIRTGRIQAGNWVDRTINLCEKDKSKFREKYVFNNPLANLTPAEAETFQ